MHVFRGLAVSLVLLLGAPAQDVTAERVQRLLAEGECQTSLPEVGNARSPGIPFPVGVATILLWCVVGGAAVLLVAALVRGARGRVEREGKSLPVRVGPAPAAAPTPDTLPDHVRLAAAGDFAAALRAMLQRAFAVAMPRTGSLPRHATARALLRQLRSEAGGHGELPIEPIAHLVEVVEHVHFGGRPADRVLYEGSRERLSQWEAAWQVPR